MKMQTTQKMSSSHVLLLSFLLCLNRSTYCGLLDFNQIANSHLKRAVLIDYVPMLFDTAVSGTVFM